MTMVDSIDKIVTSYFKAVAREKFTYKNKEYKPVELHVSPLICRGYTCPAKCGACCPRFSLDYIPSEMLSVIAQRSLLPRAARVLGTLPRVLLHPEKLRVISFNGHFIRVYTDAQHEHNKHHCKHLNMEDARCGIYTYRPFSCDFELIRFLHYDKQHIANLTQKLFGYGWKMTRIDGDRGALCEMLPPTPETVADVVRKLTRLKQWTDHFKLATCLPAVIDWVQTSPTSSLVIPSNSVTGLQAETEPGLIY